MGAPRRPLRLPRAALPRAAVPSPAKIAAVLGKRVLGQQDAVREVSVALAKKLANLRVGNILLIGSSGSGKTTLMHAVEELLAADPALASRSTVVRVHANVLGAEAEEGGASEKVLHRLLERAREQLGRDAPVARRGPGQPRARVHRRGGQDPQPGRRSGPSVGHPRPGGAAHAHRERVRALAAAGLGRRRDGRRRLVASPVRVRGRVRGAVRERVRPRHPGRRRAVPEDDDGQRGRPHPRGGPLLPAGLAALRGPLRLRHHAAVPVAVRRRGHPRPPQRGRALQDLRGEHGLRAAPVARLFREPGPQARDRRVGGAADRRGGGAAAAARGPRLEGGLPARDPPPPSSIRKAPPASPRDACASSWPTSSASWPAAGTTRPAPPAAGEPASRLTSAGGRSSGTAAATSTRPDTSAWPRRRTRSRR